MFRIGTRGRLAAVRWRNLCRKMRDYRQGKPIVIGQRFGMAIGITITIVGYILISAVISLATVAMMR